VFLPINVNHKQHGGSSWFIPNRADCVPALLSRYAIDTIWSDQASPVLEDESLQLEGDSAVIPLIPEILGIVPFIPHVVYTDCITHTARCGGGAPGAAHMEAVGMPPVIPRLGRLFWPNRRCAVSFRAHVGL